MVEAKGDGTSVSQKIRVAPLNQIVTIGEDFHSQVGDGKIRTTLDRVRWEGYDKKKKKTTGFQIVMFRPIRVDHTNCLQVDIKFHSFNLGAHHTSTGICYDVKIVQGITCERS